MRASRVSVRPRTDARADYEAIGKLSDGLNGADLRNICTEAGAARAAAPPRRRR